VGFEIVAAVLGPTLGGMITVMVWLSKKNSEILDRSFLRVYTTVDSIEKKVDDLQIEVLKNYATNDDVAKEVKDLKYEMKEALELSKDRGEKMYHELEELRRLYWETREKE